MGYHQTLYEKDEETGEVNVPNPSSFVDVFNFSGSQGGLSF